VAREGHKSLTVIRRPLAIPAIVAYNHFSQKNQIFIQEMTWVSEEILNHLTEKILDTAAMENSRLTLHLKQENIIQLLQKIILKYKTKLTACLNPNN